MTQNDLEEIECEEIAEMVFLSKLSKLKSSHVQANAKVSEQNEMYFLLNNVSKALILYFIH